jgi:signal recognition particle GTPase
MFDALPQRLDAIFDRLLEAGCLSEQNIQEALREVRVALLGADVNFKVVRSFVEQVRAKTVGQEDGDPPTRGPRRRRPDTPAQLTGVDETDHPTACRVP